MGVGEPTGALAEEKKALIRCFLYAPRGLFVPPTADAECRRIRNVERNRQHSELLDALLSQLDVERLLDDRVQELLSYHPRENDCRILAQAEACEIDVLLTYDGDFVRRLGRLATKTELRTPSEHWRRLAIPRGADPQTVPHPGGFVAGRDIPPNPLSLQTWWRWA